MKTKQWTIYAVMETDLVGTVSVPADWTEEQVWEWLSEGDSNLFASAMVDAGAGDWRWYDVQEEDEPEAYVYEVEGDGWTHVEDES